jgi:hypothetical protein
MSGRDVVLVIGMTTGEAVVTVPVVVIGVVPLVWTTPDEVVAGVSLETLPMGMGVGAGTAGAAAGAAMVVIGAA